MGVEYLQAVQGKKWDIDPRTKIFLLFLVNMTVFHGGPWYVMICFVSIPLVLLLRSGHLRGGVCYGVIALTGYVISDFIMVRYNTTGIMSTLFLTITYLVNRMLPGFAMGYYLVSTTTVSEFVAAMEKMKIPRSVIVPLSVMFRFFPTIAVEARSISDAMRMRGISFNSRKFLSNPFTMVEYRVIPLLISTVKIGEELSAASLTRGLGNPARRTNICKIGFGLFDYLLVLFCFASLVYYFLYLEEVCV